MGLFREAQNMTAYLKGGLMGFAGGGKTHTAALMAIGMWKRIKDKKPVFFMDTETGSDFLIPMFKKEGIPFFVTKTRAFTDLLQGVKEAEREASILLIDSITHFWNELQDSYKKANNRKRLLFQDWGPIKANWQLFTDAYLNSKVHILMCGRAGYEYDYFQDEDGQKQLEKTGTKMKAETDMGYEPSLLLEMVRERIQRKDGEVEGQLWDHVCYVLKDRTTLIEGKTFKNPTFECFLPVFNFLNLGGEHVGVDTGKDSTELFDKDSEKNIMEWKRKKEIRLQEIEGELTSAFPGRSAADIKAKTDILQDVFKTRSWAAIEAMPLDQLVTGLDALKKHIASLKPAESK